MFSYIVLSSKHEVVRVEICQDLLLGTFGLSVETVK